MARQMKDSGIEWIGEIPETWKLSKVKYFVDCYDGKRVPIDSGLRKSGPYPYWGAGSITDYVDDYLFDEELVLLGEDGAPFFDYTRPVAFLINEKVWVNNHIHVLKPRKTVNSRFLVHYLNNVDYKSYINGSILNKLTQSNMNNIAFTVPSLEEQEKIADYLDQQCAHIDAVIEKTKASIEEYKKLKQAVITEAVTKGVRGERPMKDSGMSFGINIPVDWDAVISRFVIDSIGDVDHAMPESTEVGYPYLMIGDLKSLSSEIDFHKAKKISEDDYNRLIQKTKTVKGDVIFARYATIGTVTYVDTDDEFVVSYACVTVHPQKEKILGKYLFYYFKSETFFNDVQQYINSNTQGNVGIEALFKTKIVVPSIEEQAEITLYLDEKCNAMDILIEKKEQTVEELELYKKSLIYEYVTGKKEVPQSCQ